MIDSNYYNNPAVYNNPISEEEIDFLCEQLDNIKFQLDENTAADVASTVIWTIIDIITIAVPTGKAITSTAKAMAKSGGKVGIKNAIRLFRSEAKVASGAVRGKKMTKVANRGMVFMLAANLLSLFSGFAGTYWDGEKIGAREGLPLVGTEFLSNGKRRRRNAAGKIVNTVGFLFEPLNAIGEYTNALRNAARSLSNQVLAAEQRDLNAAIQNKPLIGRLWRRLVGTLKNIFLNPNTSTDSVYCQEYFQMCKDKGISLTKITSIIGAEYKSLITKVYGKQLEQQELNDLIIKNIRNTSSIWGLNTATMLQGAKITANVTQDEEDGQEQEEDQEQGQEGQAQQYQQRRQVPNPVISQFQTWSQSYFKDQQGMPLNPDGLIGPRTKYVIKQFQQWANENGYANNMPVDGKWGPLTLAAFKAVQARGNNVNKTQTDVAAETGDSQSTTTTTSSAPTSSDTSEEIKEIRSLMERIDKIQKGIILKG